MSLTYQIIALQHRLTQARDAREYAAIAGKIGKLQRKLAEQNRNKSRQAKFNWLAM